MSMYTQLLEAAFGQHRPTVEGAGEPEALDEVHRCRRELDEGLPADGDTDTVPVVLALQIAYDVALLDLARVLGVDTDPSRFEQPQQERERLERAFGALGVRLGPVGDGVRLGVVGDGERPVSEFS